MDNKKHIRGIMADINKIEINFPKEIGINSVVFKLGPKKKRIMKVKEWLNRNDLSVKIEPGEFNPNMVITSRYAEKKINNKFYGVVNING